MNGGRFYWVIKFEYPIVRVIDKVGRTGGCEAAYSIPAPDVLCWRQSLENVTESSLADLVIGE